MTIVFLDVETTGLDPQHDRILEIAFAAVDAQLNPISGFVTTIQPSTPPHMDEFVRDMHTRNGLLSELDKAPLLIDVNKAVCDRLGALDGGTPGALTLAGNSAHFDLAFLKSWFPVAARMFSHRILDVTALHLARAAAGLPPCPVGKSTTHRAKDDVMGSIAQARWLLSRLTP